MKNVKFKKILIMCMMYAICILITACSTNQLDASQYGVRYMKDDAECLTIKIDPKNNSDVNCLICVNKLNEDIDTELLDSLVTGSIHDDKNTASVIYSYEINEVGQGNEYVLINFKKADLDKHEGLIKYLCLENEINDGKLTCQELTNSSSFRYKDFFTEGEFQNNISFTGEDKYTVNIK